MSHFDLSSKNKQIEEYDKQTLEQDFWQDQKKAQQVIRAKNALKDIVDCYEELDLQLTSLNDTADELKSEFDEELMMIAEEEYADMDKLSENFYEIVREADSDKEETETVPTPTEDDELPADIEETSDEMPVDDMSWMENFMQ